MVMPDSRAMWTSLIAQTNKSKDTLNLLFDILSWGRFNTASNCLFHVSLLTDLIEFMYLQNNQTVLTELIIYLASLVKYIQKYGYDPRPSFDLILKIVYLLDDSIVSYQNLIVYLLADNLHTIAPMYLVDLLRILKVR